MSELVYLATPYSKYKGGRELAYKEACFAASVLMKRGYNVFCPIAHSHAIETEAFNNIEDGDFWLKQDFAILAHCDVLFVYQMQGWDESYGVAKEIEFARERGITIAYVDDITNFNPKIT